MIRPSYRPGLRKRGHDYTAPWKYHITISKHDSCEPFSKLEISELTPDGVNVRNTMLGQIIWRAIRMIQQKYIVVYQYKIMPDHIHLLIHVKERLPVHLGCFIAKLKQSISKEWRKKRWNQNLQVFEEGYHDRIILPEHNLEDVYRYIRHNPYRLAIRWHRPDFFSRTKGITINNRQMQLYGNLFHLRNPFKYPLVVHRRDSQTDYERKLQDCLYYSANGGVIVSAFISSREKSIRAEIEKAGGRIILIQHRPLSEREKPALHDFNLCAEGRLLVMSPLDYLQLPKSEHPSRSQCLDMNSVAESICWNCQR